LRPRLTTVSMLRTGRSPRRKTICSPNTSAEKSAPIEIPSSETILCSVCKEGMMRSFSIFEIKLSDVPMSSASSLSVRRRALRAWRNFRPTFRSGGKEEETSDLAREEDESITMTNYIIFKLLEFKENYLL